MPIQLYFKLSQLGQYVILWVETWVYDTKVRPCLEHKRSQLTFACRILDRIGSKGPSYHILNSHSLVNGYTKWLGYMTLRWALFEAKKALAYFGSEGTNLDRIGPKGLSYHKLTCLVDGYAKWLGYMTLRQGHVWSLKGTTSLLWLRGQNPR